MTKKGSRDLVVLDTHTWIWLINGNERLISSESLQSIEKAAELSLDASLITQDRKILQYSQSTPLKVVTI